MEGPEDRVPCEDFATCGAAQFQNRQYQKNAKQQDSYFVVEDLGATFGARLGESGGSAGSRVALYGVADGHGEFGEVSANFVRRHLPPQLARSPHFAAGRLDGALADAFAQTELLQQSAGLPLWASGACALAAAVSETHIVVANCGDCRCVLAEQGGRARDLSEDHNVENASNEEFRRVLSAGGTITPDKRVTLAGAPGRLATTRSLGDYWAKPQGPPEKHVISAVPDVRVFPRQPGQDFLLLASDGIFGFMSSQDVVSQCVSLARQRPPNAPLSGLAHAMVCTAVHKMRSDDNCTCLVVELGRVEGPVVDQVSQNVHVAPQHWPEIRLGSPEAADARRSRLPPQQQSGLAAEQLSPAAGQRCKGGCEQRTTGAQDSDSTTLPSSSVAAADEVCWCPWCWGMNPEGDCENMVLGSFERWRLHMHDQHFDKLGEAYGADEIVPCYWCCRPCVTKKGQHKSANRLPFWGSHERVCRENPSKPVLSHGASSGGSQTSGSEKVPRRWQVAAPGGARRSDDGTAELESPGLEPLHRGAGVPPAHGGGAGYRGQLNSNDLRERDALRDVRERPAYSRPPGHPGRGPGPRYADEPAPGYLTPPCGGASGSEPGLMSSPEGMHSASPPLARQNRAYAMQGAGRTETGAVAFGDWPVPAAGRRRPL